MAMYTNNSDYNNGLGVSSLYFLGDTSNFLTTDGIQTITGKTIDFNQNTILNGGSGGGGGGSGDTIAPSTHGSYLIPKWGVANSKTLTAGVAAPNGIIVGTFDNQTLTNKSIDYNLNQIVNIPQFNPNSLNTGISNVSIRTSNLEIKIITFDPLINALKAEDIILDGRIDTNTDDITAVDLRVDAIEPQLVTLDNRIDLIEPILITQSNLISNNSDNIILNTSRLTVVESSNLSNSNSISTNSNNITTLNTVVSNLSLSNVSLSNIVSLNTNQINNNITKINEKVIAPVTNTSMYIPQWSSTNSKTLIDGIQAPSSALVGVSDSQTLVSKTIDYNLNNIINIPNADNTVLINGIAQNSNNIVSLSNNLVGISNNLVNVISKTGDQTSQIATINSSITNININYNSLSNALSNDIINLSTLSNVVSTNTTQIYTNSNNLVSLSNTVLSNTTQIFSLSNYVNTLSGNNYTPSLSNITVVNSNIPISVLNVANPYKFRAYMSSDSGGGYPNTTTIAFNAKSYDLNNNYSTSTYKYTVPITGYYDICSEINYKAVNAGTRLYLNVFINGSVSFSYLYISPDANLQACMQHNDKTLLNVNDTVYLAIYAGYGVYDTYTTMTGSYFAMNLISSTTPSNVSIVSNTTYNAYSYTGSGNIMTGQTNSNNYIPYWSSNNSTFLTNGIDLASIALKTDLGKMLKTATTNIDISTATAPTSNQVLTAISASNAVWSTPAPASGCDLIATLTTTGTSSTLQATWTKIYKRLHIIGMNIRNNAASGGATQYLGCDFSSNGGSTFSGTLNIAHDYTTTTTITYTTFEIFANDIAPLSRPLFMTTYAGNDYYGNPKYLTTPITGTINGLRFGYGNTTQFMTGTFYIYGYY